MNETTPATAVNQARDSVWESFYAKPKEARLTFTENTLIIIKVVHQPFMNVLLIDVGKG